MKIFSYAFGMRSGSLRGEVQRRSLGPRKADQVQHVPTVPQTDTGRQVEDTKVFERTLVKELGKWAP